jgi:hypothetical protein
MLLWDTISISKAGDCEGIACIHQRAKPFRDNRLHRCRSGSEVCYGSANVLAPGVDARDTWVYARTFTFGVNVKF